MNCRDQSSRVRAPCWTHTTVGHLKSSSSCLNLETTSRAAQSQSWLPSNVLYVHLQTRKTIEVYKILDGRHVAQDPCLTSKWGTLANFGSSRLFFRDKLELKLPGHCSTGAFLGIRVRTCTGPIQTSDNPALGDLYFVGGIRGSALLESVQGSSKLIQGASRSRRREVGPPRKVQGT